MIVSRAPKNTHDAMHDASAIANLRACCVRGSAVSALSLSFLPGASDCVERR